jgi:hypothetical protein
MAVENMYTSAGSDINGVSIKEVYRKLHGSSADSSTPTTTAKPENTTGQGTTVQTANTPSGKYTFTVKK